MQAISLARKLIVSAGLALVALGGGLQAQTPIQTPPASPPAQPPQTVQTTPEQRPVIRRSFDLIRQDVIPSDRKGQFVADLKKNEFEVYEDGVKQEVVTFVLTHGGRTMNIEAPPPPPPQEGIILPPMKPTSDASGRIFVIFVDDLHLNFRDTGRIKELLKKIRKQLIHEGDLFTIVSTGPSSIAIDATYDLKRLDEAINKISGAGLKPSEILDVPEGADGPPEVKYRANVAFSTAYEILKNLEQVHNRRKAFIYVSNGYDFNPFEEARKGENPFFQGRFGQSAEEAEANPFLRQGQQFAEADLARELAELTRAANRANATIYTIDPRGLVGGPDLDEQIDPTEWYNYVRNSIDSLRVLAEETGGIAVVNQNDFEKALKRIDAETSDYYVLGYYSSNPDPTRRVRNIQVKVTREDVNVWSRRSYSLRSLPESSPAKR